ncbi:MAG: hypothetical protein JNL88_04660 [Bacteroidia bacterium]|nr:hypothetical protein [Bacteroidia bacterium]
MNEKDHLNTLSDIRSLMERSSRFLPLSGMSGIFIGLYALAGAWFTAWYLREHFSGTGSSEPAAAGAPPESLLAPTGMIVLVAFLVLSLSLLTAYYFTRRRAVKEGLALWDASARRMLLNLCIPLAAGGLYCLALWKHQHPELLAPAMLLFYGLALLHAAKYTYNDLRFLGLAEMMLGLLASFLTEYGLTFWALGFGLLHILYGITMYYKYER